MSKSHAVSLALAAAILAALAGCASWWDIGPEPSNFVGKGNSESLLSDPNLKAVTPRVAGDEPGGAATLPSAATQPRPLTAPTIAPPSTGPAEIPEALSVQDAILAGLEHNVSLRVQRLSVPISRTSQQQALSSFDPSVNYSLSGGRSGGNLSGTVDSITGSASVTEFLPTGTTIQAGVTTSNNFYSESALTQGGSLSVTQSLLRGAGLNVNLAALRKAEISTRVTQYQLRNTAETLVANIESAYWDLAFAELQIAIVQYALNVAQKQLDDTATRVRLEKLAASELPAAQAQVASRREDLINANSTLENARLKFLQLLTPADRGFWNRSVKLSTLPFIPQGTMDAIDNHIEVAMRYRPDINEALLQLQSGDLEIVRTKNGLLPKLDFVISLTKSGSSYTFGDSVLKGFDSPVYKATAGIQGDWEPINRAAESSYRSAQLTKEQLQGSLDNQRQLAELQVRTQYIEVQRTRSQIDATRATREAQQATYDVQAGKLAAGSGTSLDVAIAQNNLLAAQLNEVQTVTNHLKALVTLYQTEGTLLLRRGLAAPGSEPVTAPARK